MNSTRFMIFHLFFGIAAWLSFFIAIGASILAGAAWLMDKPFATALNVAIVATIVFVVSLILVLVNFFSFKP